MIALALVVASLGLAVALASLVMVRAAYVRPARTIHTTHSQGPPVTVGLVDKIARQVRADLAARASRLR